MTPKASGAWRREFRAIIAVSWPLALGNLTQVAMGTTDVLMMGRLGPDTLAAGALGTNLYFIAFIFGAGLLNATAPLIARALGRDPGAAAPIRETVEQWPEIMDFMLRTKVPRSSYLQWGEEQAQNVSRYYIAKGGKPLLKWMPPLAKKPGVWRQIGVESGWNVQVCNNVKDATLPVDFDYYVREVEKLCLSLA